MARPTQGKNTLKFIRMHATNTDVTLNHCTLCSRLKVLQVAEVQENKLVCKVQEI
jgi:hypothetical protein